MDCKLPMLMKYAAEEVTYIVVRMGWSGVGVGGGGGGGTPQYF